MKKIVNNRIYDTDKARSVGEWSNGGNWRDFNHVVETLYVKRTGEFFLHGEGGPMTKYAVLTGSTSWSGGEKIIPLTYEAAKEWAEEKLSADEFEDIFGEVAEDDSKMQLCISISTAAAEIIRREAAKSGITISAYIESLVKP